MTIDACNDPTCTGCADPFCDAPGIDRLMTAYLCDSRGAVRWIEPLACAVAHGCGGNIPFADCEPCRETRSHTWRHLVKEQPR